MVSLISPYRIQSCLLNKFSFVELNRCYKTLITRKSSEAVNFSTVEASMMFYSVILNMYFKDFWHSISHFRCWFKYFFPKKSESFLYPYVGEGGEINENSIWYTEDQFKSKFFKTSYFLKHHYNWWHSHKQFCISPNMTEHKANTRCSLECIRYWNRKFAWSNNTHEETN